MRIRKIVTGIVIASTLSLSAPVLAAPAPDVGMLEGDGGGFAGGGSLSIIALLLSLAGLTLSIIAIVVASKSP